MAIFTDAALREHLPSLEGKPIGDINQVVADAAAVYSYVNQRPGLREVDLRKWGEQNEIGPDRMTAALTVLLESGKLYHLPEDAPLPGPDRPEHIRGDLLTAAELKTVAERVKLEVPKSANKADLIVALAKVA